MARNENPCALHPSSHRAGRQYSKELYLRDALIEPSGAYLATPAFAKMISSLPLSCLICAKSRSRSARSLRHFERLLRCLPIARRSVTKASAPSLTNCFVVARPIPLLPPVMSAIFPQAFPYIFSLFKCLQYPANRSDRRNISAINDVFAPGYRGSSIGNEERD